MVLSCIPPLVICITLLRKIRLWSRYLDISPYLRFNVAFGFYSNLVILLFSSVMPLFGTWPGLGIALKGASHLSGAQMKEQSDVASPDSRWQYSILETQCFVFRLLLQTLYPQPSIIHCACSLTS